MNKTLLTIVIVVALAGLAFAGFWFFRDNNNGWICQNSQWINQGNPSSPRPAEPCPDGQTQEPEVVIALPQPNQLITSPLTVEGKAKGNWFFEAEFPLKIIDANNKEIASWFVTAQDDWMTADFVRFKGEIEFRALPSASIGTLILHNSNPSDRRDLDKEFKIPVRFNPVEGIKVKTYFFNSNLDPEVTCIKVFPVEREIPKTQAPAKAALEELLKGPTAFEKNQGYRTDINLNPSVKIQKLSIENGLAKVDFNQALEEKVGGACRVSLIKAQIIETLKQFPSVKDVIISINGRTDLILQP